jgi:hypothetical protein
LRFEASPEKSFKRPYLESPSQKRAGGVAQSPEFNPSTTTTTKKKKKRKKQNKTKKKAFIPVIPAIRG